MTEQDLYRPIQEDKKDENPEQSSGTNDGVLSIYSLFSLQPTKSRLVLI